VLELAQHELRHHQLVLQEPGADDVGDAAVDDRARVDEHREPGRGGLGARLGDLVHAHEPQDAAVLLGGGEREQISDHEEQRQDHPLADVRQRVHREPQERGYEQADQQANRGDRQLAGAPGLDGSLDPLEATDQSLADQSSHHPADGEDQEDDDGEDGVRVRSRIMILKIEGQPRLDGTQDAQEGQDDPG
jgi:hypothetical protein